MNRSATMLLALAAVLPVNALAQKLDVTIQLAKPGAVVMGKKSTTAAVKARCSPEPERRHRAERRPE